jgi:hypothetical protein
MGLLCFIIFIDRSDPEVFHLHYKIKTELRHQPAVTDRIFKTIATASEKVGIPVVSEG